MSRTTPSALQECLRGTNNSDYTPPSFTEHLYYTPEENRTTSEVTEPKKRLAKLGIIVPPKTRQCLRTPNEENHGLQSRPLYTANYSKGISVHDESNQGNIQQVTTYVTDIYQRLYTDRLGCTYDSTSTLHIYLLPMMDPFSTFPKCLHRGGHQPTPIHRLPTGHSHA